VTALAADYLTLLRDAEFVVHAQGDRLFVQPRERLTEADTGMIRELKTPLMQLLAVERMRPCEGRCGAEIDPDAATDLARTCPVHGCPFRPPPPVRTIAPRRKQR
jgi:hypothetical protein